VPDVLHLVQILICIGVPLFFASLIAHMVGLPQFTRRIAIVVFVGVASLAGLFPLSQAWKLGIDLSGGTILVYQVQQPVPAGFQIDRMVAAINRRVNPAGIMDVTVRGVGNDRVEIIIPRAAKEDVERYKRVLTSVGSLEFRILANSRDHRLLIEQGEGTFPNPVVQNGHVLARWVPVAAKAHGTIGGHGGVVVRTDAQRGDYVLVVLDELNVTGELLWRAESTMDDHGQPAVSFQFGPVGAQRFARLTEQNRPDPDGFERRLAILLDGEVYSAPNLRDRISENGIITGSFSPQEVEDMVGVLNAGMLPGIMQKVPASELSIGPTLGRDTIHSGLTAVVIGAMVVLVFMAAYYRLAGLVADAAVILNVIIVIGVMSWIHATWTLPGLAGLALTIGMAVDANVLIFERLREEQQRGRTLRLAIGYAFDRAFRPIFDSNVTTLLAAVVLYALGTEQVKGFAVTLVIGLVANLFTAVFVCRLVFDVLERNRWITRVGMARIFEQPKFDFAGKRRIALTGSLLLIAGGLVGVWLRGSDLLDIDFTGGTLAAVRFRRPTDSATVRVLAGQILPDVAVEEVQLTEEPAGQRFLIRTTMQDQDRVRTLICQELGDLLASSHMTSGPIEVIPKADAPPVAQAPAAPKSHLPHAAAPASGPSAVTRKPFAGGNRVDLAFDEPMTLRGFRSHLDQYLIEQKTPNPKSHYFLSGLGSASQDKDAYRQMRLEADLSRTTLQQMLARIGQRVAAESTFERLDNFGAQVARETQARAGLAILVSMLAIVVYLWVRFQNVAFGLGAVIALIHDVLVVLGLVGLSRWLSSGLVGKLLLLETFKINLPMTAAFLTLVGYSVNDTIVVFDRIRELRGRSKQITWELINNGINQTLSRTLLTSFTVWVVALILYAVGGMAIHGFAFCLVMGVIVGTYSSIYIASPVLMWLRKKVAPKESPLKETPAPTPPGSLRPEPTRTRKGTSHGPPKRPRRKAA
jgi:SecD/SecF fusion protein